MAERSVALAILGLVAVIATVGLVLLFSGAMSGRFVEYGQPKIYPGKVVAGQTGPGSQYLGEGAYVYEQKGSCYDYEFFSQSPQAGGAQCRPGEVRVEVYQRNRKFFGVPDQSYTVQGSCCLTPTFKAPRVD
jgi:hypothetical protein